MSDATVKTSATIVGPVRLSYLNVFKARLNNLNQKMEYSVRLLIPKKPTDKCPDPKKIIDICADAIKAAKAEKIPDVKVWDNPLRDGDKELDSNTGEPKEPGYWYINAKANEEYPPELCDAKRLPVTPDMGWGSGDWGKVVLAFYGYDQAKKGVGCGLRCIQFIYKDESLGGGGSVAHLLQEEQGDDPTALTSHADSAASPAVDEYDPFGDE